MERFTGLVNGFDDQRLCLGEDGLLSAADWGEDRCHSGCPHRAVRAAE